MTQFDRPAAPGAAGRAHRSEPVPPGRGLREIGLVDLFDEAVAAAPERDALLYSGYGQVAALRWTYRDLARQATAAARALVAAGVRHGERVAVWAPNRPEFVPLWFGAASVGVALVPVNPLYRHDEIAYLLSKVDAKLCFLTPTDRGVDLAAILERARPDLPDLNGVIAWDALPGETGAGWDAWLATGDVVTDATLAERRAQITPEDIVLVQFTSGTTGRPKGVECVSRAIANQGLAVAERAGIEDGCRYANPMPLFHNGGAVVVLMACTARRGTHLLIDKFEAGLTCRVLQDLEATAILGVPSMLLAMVEHAEAAGLDFPSLRTVVTGGSLVPEPLMRRWLDRWRVGFSNVYGMTEFSPVATQTSPGDTLERALTTVGRPLPGVEIDVVDPSTAERVGFGQEGEIRYRGWPLMRGYCNDPERTSEAVDPDGWLRSGDLGVLDAEGYLRVTGRSKDTIIRGGENIAPAAVEAAILRHVPAVADVAVVGVPDTRYGEVVAAFVRLREGMSLSHDELVTHLTPHIVRFRIPAHLRVVDSFPLTPSGKVQKFRLREQMAEEAADA